MANGTIKRLVRDKGFGFIRATESDDEFFFHKSGLVRGLDFDTLNEGERVIFDEESGNKGPRAGNVERA